MAWSFCGPSVIICLCGTTILMLKKHREDWDGPPVQQRANRRFEQRLMKSGEQSLCALSPAIEEEFGGIVAPDLTPTEVEMGHVPLREALVRNFEILWKKKQVQWLKYPDSKTQKPL